MGPSVIICNPIAKLLQVKGAHVKAYKGSSDCILHTVRTQRYITGLKYINVHVGTNGIANLNDCTTFY